MRSTIKQLAQQVPRVLSASQESRTATGLLPMGQILASQLPTETAKRHYSRNVIKSLEQRKKEITSLAKKIFRTQYPTKENLKLAKEFFFCDTDAKIATADDLAQGTNGRVYDIRLALEIAKVVLDTKLSSKQGIEIHSIFKEILLAQKRSDTKSAPTTIEDLNIAKELLVSRYIII